MNIIDRFLNEDLLIIKPSVYIYIPKDQCDLVEKNGISLSDNRISSYLIRLPEDNDSYRDYLEANYPVRLTISRLNKIKDQDVNLIPVNMDVDGELDEDKIGKLRKKYSYYLNICYNDHIPLDQIPHIDIEFSKKFIPGFVCKILKNSFGVNNKNETV